MPDRFIILYLPQPAAEVLAVPDGEPANRLHLTLVAFDDKDRLTHEHLANLLERWCSEHPPLSGEISGFGVFSEGGDGRPVLHATFDSPALPEFRQSLAETLVENGYTLADDHGFDPHITLKYLEGDRTEVEVPDLPPLQITFTELSYSHKKEDGTFDVYPFKLADKEESMTKPADSTASAEAKSVEVQDPPVETEPAPTPEVTEPAGEALRHSLRSQDAAPKPEIKAEGEDGPPNYHKATEKGSSCANCNFFRNGRCENYEIAVEDTFVCDDFLENDAATEAEGEGEGAAEEVAEGAAGEAKAVPSPEALEDIKTGARHSKADFEAIQTMHDTSVKLGAACASDANKFTVTGTKAWSLNERQMQVAAAWDNKRIPGYPRDVLDDALVIGRDGKLFSYPYTIVNGEVTFDEPVPVVVRYEETKALTSFNDPDFAIKALGETSDGLIIGGPLVLYGAPDEKDLSGDYFIKSTELWLDRYPKAPTLFHHGLDQAVGLSVVGHRIKAMPDDIGVWVESWLDKRSKYLKMVRPLLEAKALFYSPGSASHLVRRAEDGCLKAFPVIEDTLTPTPMQHRLLPIEQIKSAYRVLGLDDPLAAAEAESPAVPAPTPAEIVATTKAAVLDELLKLEQLPDRYQIFVP
ncbi:MAG: 2'-5' RNA ligase family protein [Anaerolineae bacterium]|nr:2'-5' RNA ligase family protein [Anaerolineae bacterium]